MPGKQFKRTRTLHQAPRFFAVFRELRLKAVLTLLALLFIRSGHNTSFGLGATSLLAQGGDIKKTVTILGDPQQPFHPGHIIVRFRNEAKPRVIPTPDPMSAVARYRLDSSVLYAEPDYRVHVDTTTPTDPLWPQQWDMAKISAPQAWDAQSSAADVVVAILDTGIDYTHP